MEKWDKNSPIEKSLYVNNQDILIRNIENFKKCDVNNYNMIDLFSGAGGFAVGCGWAGFESVLGIDYFKSAIDTWSLNHPNAISILGDIKKINPNDIKDLLNKKGIDKIHLITGGVPCQGFSIANRKRNENDERNFLFLEFMRFVEVFNPDSIIIENVSGLRSSAGGKFEKEILDYMNRLGYDAKVELLNAADFGVPQVRKRVIFVGIKKSLKEVYQFPIGKFSNNHRTVSDAINDLPYLDNNEQKTLYEIDPQNDFQLLMRSNFNNSILQNELLNHKSPNHPEATIDKIRSTEPGKPMYTKFKQRIRLDYEKPSPTQLAGGIRPQFQFGHPSQPRGLSIRERARIQSFPDGYQFVGGIVQERVQTGNAVPPLLIYEVAKNIKNIIDNKYKKQ